MINIHELLQRVFEADIVQPERPQPIAPPAPNRTTPPERRKSPIKPIPGKHPKPKGNKDVELFLKKRGIVDEMAFDPGAFKDITDPSKRAWIETGTEDLSEILPDATDSQQSYLEMVTSKSYIEMLNRVERYTGLNVDDIDVPQLIGLLFQSMNTAAEIEKNNINALENIALMSVLSLDEFSMVKDLYDNDEVKFDIELMSRDKPLDIDLMQQHDEEQNPDDNGLTDNEETNLELADELISSDNTKMKRRLADLLIQGNAVSKLYLFNVVRDKLNAIDERLPALYGIAATMTQLGYWVTPFGIEEMSASAEEMTGGAEEVIPSGDIYVIKARGQIFPMLVHEIVKGIYEYISLNNDIGTASGGLRQETEDIIVGPEIAKTLKSYVPLDQQELLPLVHKLFLELSQSDIKNVLAKNSQGKSTMDELLKQAEEQWDEYNKEENEYEDEGEEPEEFGEQGE